GPAVADVRDGAAAEVEGPAGGVADDLDAVGVLPLLGAGGGHGQGGHVGLGVALEQLRQQVEGGGVHERLVALQGDDAVGVEAAGGLGGAVGAAGVVAPGQQDPAAETLDGGDDARVVGGDDDGAGAGGLAGPLVDVLDEVLAGLPQEGLAGQATGAVAR